MLKAIPLQTDADIAAYGVRLRRPFDFIHLGPEFASAEDALGAFRFEQAQGDADTYPPACIAADVSLLYKRHPRGASLTETDGDAERLVRRVEHARKYLGALPSLPPKGLAADTDTRTPALETVARILLERYALPKSCAVVAIVMSLRTVEGAKKVKTSPSEVTEAVERMAEQPDALWPWDDLGEALDDQARDAELARLLAEKGAAERALEDARPNVKTCRDLRVFVTKRNPKSPDNALTCSTSSYVQDGWPYYVHDASDLLGLGLQIPAGAFDAIVGEMLPSDYVIPRTVAEVRAMSRLPMHFGGIGSTGLAVLSFRKGKIDSSPVTSFRTLRDSEGAWLVNEIEHIFEPYAALPANTCAGKTTAYRPESILGGGLFFRLVVEAYARNGVRKDVAWDSFNAMVTRMFLATCEDPYIVTPSRVVYVDIRGVEHDSPVHRSPLFIDSTTGVQQPQTFTDEYCDPYTVKSYPETRTPRPLPSSVSVEGFSRTYDAAVRGGPDVLIGLDEILLTRPPESSFIEKVLAAVRIDPWRAELVKLTKERTTPITSEEIEQALRSANHVEALDHKGHTRVLTLMQRLGWVKKNPTIDGVRKWAFVRTDGGDA